MLRRAFLPLLGLLLLAPQSDATWSIVCVNKKTREVGVASATCLAAFNLRNGVPVIVVGEGAAAAQSSLDAFGQNRRLIFDSFRNTDDTPAEILAALAARDSHHQTRQYGIANFTGLPVTFTGTGDGPACTGVAGIDGEIAYSIQGNVLTGNEVVLAAELAFRGEKGDMGQKMMAAMEAARALGGDGRCSCNAFAPTSCGVPPPNFVKSAHAGVVIVARVGDNDGPCDANNGCAQGQYYLGMNVRGNDSDPDPVFTLQERYKSWRDRLVLRPDGINSRMGPMKALPTDGTTERQVQLQLFDLDERRITHGGAAIELETVDGLPSFCQVGAIDDHGDGSYTITLHAGTDVGQDRFYVRVIDVNPANPSDIVRATLFPLLEIANVDAPLYAGADSFSAASGGSVPFVVNRADRPLAPYLLVARLDTGRVRPGTLSDASFLPIAERPFFPAGPLALDAHGRSETTLVVPPGVLAPLVGRRIEVTGFVLGGAHEATNSVALDVEP